MADKRDHNAHLNAKGLEDAVTDEQAGAMIATRGESSVFIVEAVHGPFVTNLDGSQKINLLPGAVALVPTKYEDKLRKLLRAIALEQNPGETFALDGDADVPKVEEAADDLPTGWTGDPADPGSEPKPPAKKALAKKAAKKAPAKKAAATRGGLASVPDAN